MQVLDEPSILPDEESSYKEEDDIDLGECFERFEKEFLAQKKRLDQRLVYLQQECQLAKEGIILKEEEVRATVQGFERVNQEIEDLKARFEVNDVEMRRQLGNAAKKIDKYKTKVSELNAEQLLTSKKNVKAAEQSESIGAANGDLAQENLMLLQRL